LLKVIKPDIQKFMDTALHHTVELDDGSSVVQIQHGDSFVALNYDKAGRLISLTERVGRQLSHFIEWKDEGSEFEIRYYKGRPFHQAIRDRDGRTIYEDFDARKEPDRPERSRTQSAKPEGERQP
jgi:YD repeat-containing protein